MEKIVYGFYDSEFGQMLIAKSDVGICWLGFAVEDNKRGDALSCLQKYCADATLMRSDTVGKSLGDTIINAYRADMISSLTLDLRGTEFQEKVWNALLQIKKGETQSYGDIAKTIGKPNAHRAVGTAVGQNPVSLVVPCHRVIQKSGAMGNYMWGPDIKRKILKEEGVDL